MNKSNFVSGCPACVSCLHVVNDYRTAQDIGLTLLVTDWFMTDIFISALFFSCSSVIFFIHPSIHPPIPCSLLGPSYLGQTGEDVDIMWLLSSWWSRPLVLPLLSLLVGISCPSALHPFFLPLLSAMCLVFNKVFLIIRFEIQTLHHLNVVDLFIILSYLSWFYYI